MRGLFTAVSVVLFSALSAFAQNFPIHPDPTLTPGALCKVAEEIRYAERISYCNRRVDTRQKWAVINLYTKKFNFAINTANRLDFKIDHFIPLCMGGANDLSNLWPQHISVYTQTDIVEKTLCDKMSMGLLHQDEAIAQIKRVKLDLSQVSAVMRELALLKLKNE